MMKIRRRMENLGENIVIQNGIFYNGSTEKEAQTLIALFPDKEIMVHTIRPGEAHVTVFPNKEEVDRAPREQAIVQE